MVSLQSVEADEDEPSFITARFLVVGACHVYGDRMGEAAIVGGPLLDGDTGRLGQSRGT